MQERALRRFYHAGPGAEGGLTRAHLAAALRLAGPQGAPGRWVQWPGGVALVREYGALARRVFDPQTGAFDLAADAVRYPLLLTPGTYPLSEGDAGPGLGPWRITLRRRPPERARQSDAHDGNSADRRLCQGSGISFRIILAPDP